jgi:hypothetical protein
LPPIRLRAVITLVHYRRCSQGRPIPLANVVRRTPGQLPRSHWVVHGQRSAAPRARMSGSHGYDTVAASARAKVGARVAAANGGCARVRSTGFARALDRALTPGQVLPVAAPRPTQSANAVARHAGATLADGAGRSTSAGIDEASLLDRGPRASRAPAAGGRGQPQQPVKELIAEAAATAGEAEAAAMTDTVARAYHSLEALQAARKGDSPAGGAPQQLEGVDYAHKERHLGDADFAKVSVATVAAAEERKRGRAGCRSIATSSVLFATSRSFSAHSRSVPARDQPDTPLAVATRVHLPHTLTFVFARHVQALAQAFNMDRAAFDALPPWKQAALKKAAHLF